ncbi:MAG: glycolate oxidase FAD binding subunit [Paracoccaceae bacterium]|jgi:glycolate oxidase FAD binding subunit
MLAPENEAQLSEIIAGATGPLRIIGGGTRPIGRPLIGESLSVAGLSGVSLYEPGSLTIVAAAGTPLAEIQQTLAAENQRLPFEPMDHRKLLGTTGTPTIGGMVAGNVSGSRRIQAGACRDSLIGVRFVDGQGTAIKNGGRVMKNVTGYDLVKLMAGSHGTLGVLSEVAFKVLPGVESVAVLMIRGLEDAAAISVLSKALGSPFEVSGAAHAPQGQGDAPLTMIRLEGFTASVAYRAKCLQDLLAQAGDIAVETDRTRAEDMWRWVCNVEGFADQPGDVWRVSVKPGDGPTVGARLDGAPCLYDWGGGLVWALLPTGTDLRAKLGGLPGHATLVRASEGTRARLPSFHPEPAPLARIAQGLRDRFDPRGILNPGLMA